MKKIIFLLLIVFLAGCASQTVLVVDKDGKVAQKYKGHLGEKVFLVHVREDGTFETFSPDRGSVTFSRDRKKVFYHGTWYEYRGGRYYGGYYREPERAPYMYW